MAIHILIISIKDFLANEMKIEGRNEQNLHKNNHTLSILLKHLNYSIWTNLHLDYFISVPDYRLHHFVDIINKCTYFRTIDIIIWQKFKDFIFHIPPSLFPEKLTNETTFLTGFVMKKYDIYYTFGYSRDSLHNFRHYPGTFHVVCNANLF